MSGLGAAFTADFLVYCALGLVILILFGFVVNLHMEVSTLKSRYKRMMEGSEGENIAGMLAEHTSKFNKALDEQRSFERKLETLEEQSKSSLARVAVVHFDAFEKTGQGLSWCLALLDRENNGIVISSICGQETARTYVKPIEDGRVTEKYKLTREEEQAIQQAMRR